ncbi:MAG: RepB family DNA primase [Candidatus Binataceae bacterium]
MNSSPIARNSVMCQLAAMACQSFEIGVLRPDGRMLLREGLTVEQIDRRLGWLRRENAFGAHIYIRPSGAHALSLVDDLSAASLKRMKEAGFEPALVVETSPANFQAWLNHGRVLTCALSTQVAKDLARRFGGDPSSADWRHFGRLAGFTNQKPGRRLPRGLPPFVQLRQSRGGVYTAAPEFIEQVIALVERSGLRTAATAQPQTHSHEKLHRAVSDFHHDFRYAGDLHRADMAWAIYAASRGVSEQQIKDEILHARDLSKKGGPARQLDYAERTATKALTAGRAKD